MQLLPLLFFPIPHLRLLLFSFSAISLCRSHLISLLCKLLILSFRLHPPQNLESYVNIFCPFSGIVFPLRSQNCRVSHDQACVCVCVCYSGNDYKAVSNTISS